MDPNLPSSSAKPTDDQKPIDDKKPIDYKKILINKNVIEYKFLRNEGTNFTFKDFIEISKNQDDSDNFTEAISRALTDSTTIFKSFFWECPPIRQDTVSDQFQFVTVNAPELSRIEEDYSSFKGQFENFKGSEGDENKIVCSFLNLGGDGIMVCPLPVKGKDFAHLANFNENADFNTKKKFWEKVAEDFGTALKDDEPKWLSTNGMGVYYLHARIDQRPKYYEYKSYRKFSPSSML